jgi:hypothetical protein
MKKRMINRFAAIALSMALSVVLVSSANASDRDSSNVAVDLQFVGKINSEPVFRLTVSDNADKNNLSVTVMDDNGDVLYKDALKKHSQSVRFILSGDIEETSLHFSIYDQVSKKTIVYEVNPKYVVDENFDVTKL